MPDELTERIIGAAIEVHRHLGPGLLETIYEEALAHELNLRQTRCERQVAVDVYYKDIRIRGQRLDLLVETRWSSKLNRPTACRRRRRLRYCRI